ncbi:MAG: glycosyl hydrolase family 2, partial [Prevotella sp.]|nr:glycosyl hydrolase family 2 [Prevotella sp.]
DENRMRQAAEPEALRTRLGLRAIRRSNSGGHHYFIANLTPEDKSGWTPLAVPVTDAAWFNPLNGDILAAKMRGNQVYVNLRSGESMILQTFDRRLTSKPDSILGETPAVVETLDLTHQPWQLTFVESAPAVEKTYMLDHVQTWEGLDDGPVRTTMGTGCYTTTVKLDKKQALRQWSIDLGDVRESARVYVNGELVGCAWSVPFTLDLGRRLHKGNNELRIEVTNLPANRIADMDRRGEQWRIMEEINVVDLNYKKTTYENWEPVLSGLHSEVKLIAR